ncbi:hypothetical protein GCM10025871_31420 [Deinococcus metallilatus]|nr:hypothetical protein GCM10025871_31420 [Deinococcus metallilatus]
MLQASWRPEIDAGTAEQFSEERKRLYELASSALADLERGTDEQTVTLYLGALAVAKGHARLGNFLMQVGEEWECEECGTPFPGYHLEN